MRQTSDKHHHHSNYIIQTAARNASVRYPDTKPIPPLMLPLTKTIILTIIHGW